MKKAYLVRARTVEIFTFTIGNDQDLNLRRRLIKEVNPLVQGWGFPPSWPESTDPEYGHGPYPDVVEVFTPRTWAIAKGELSQGIWYFDWMDDVEYTSFEQALAACPKPTDEGQNRREQKPRTSASCYDSFRQTVRDPKDAAAFGVRALEMTRAL